MSEPIVYVDHSEVREGKLAALKSAIQNLVELVEKEEPRLLAYHVFWSEQTTRMSVLHIHPDPASLEFHLSVAGPRFADFREFIRLLCIDVYGDPGERVVEILQRKAEMLGGGVVRVHRERYGFSRFG